MVAQIMICHNGDLQVHPIHDSMAQGTMDSSAMDPRNHDFLRARGQMFHWLVPVVLTSSPKSTILASEYQNADIQYHENVLFTAL